MEDEMSGSARGRGSRETLAAVVFIMTFLGSAPAAAGTSDETRYAASGGFHEEVSVAPANLTVNGFSAGTPGSMHIVPPVSSLRWDHVDPNGSPQTAYRVEVRNGPNGTGFMFDYRDGIGNATSYIFGSSGNSTNLSRGATYWFRVRAQSQGNWSAFSEMRFRLNTPPTSPTNIDPSDGQIVPLSPAQRTRWSPSFDSQNDTIVYEWIVDLSRPPAAPHVANGSSSNVTSDPFATQAGIIYYWYVRASDGYELSTWSNFANGTDFTAFQPNRAPFVAPANLSVPGLLHPAVFESATVLYEDPDGPNDLSTAWLRVSAMAGSLNFTLRGFNGTAASGLPADIFGDGVRIATYDRASGPAGLSITWHFALDWTWIGQDPLLIEARALDRSASSGPWVGSGPVPFERFLSTTSSSSARVQLRVGESATFNGTFGYANVAASIEFFENLSVHAALDSVDGLSLDTVVTYDQNYALGWGPLAADVGVHQVYITARRDAVAPPDSDVYWERIQVEVLPGIPPFVISATPEEGDKAVGLQPVVRIVFSAEMNASSTLAAVKLAPDVSGGVIQLSGRVLTIERMRLRENTEYLVRVEASATDANGTRMSTDFVLRFRTQAPGGDPLTELAEVFVRNPLILLGLVGVFAGTMVLTGVLSRRKRNEDGRPPSATGSRIAASPPGQEDQGGLAAASAIGASSGPDGAAAGGADRERPDFFEENSEPSEGLGSPLREPGPVEREEEPLAPTESPIVTGGPEFPGAGTSPASPMPAATAAAPTAAALAAARLAIERRKRESEPATPAPAVAAPSTTTIAGEAALKHIVPGNNYLLIHDHNDPALRVAARTVLRGGRAMVVTHVAPVKLRRQFFLPKGVMVMWLTDMEDAPGGINPKRMEFELAKAMLNFIREGDGGVLVIDCFEHLVQENGFERSFASLKRVLDASSESGASVIAVMNSKSLGERIADVRTAFDKIVEDL